MILKAHDDDALPEPKRLIMMLPTHVRNTALQCEFMISTINEVMYVK